MTSLLANPQVHTAFELFGYAAALLVYSRRRPEPNPLGARESAAVIAGAVIGAALGMRLLVSLSYRNVSAVLGGKTAVGGLLGGLIGVEIAKALLGVRRSTGDRFVFPIIAALAIGRIGCFLTGPIDRTAGVPTDLPWGIAIGDGVRRHPVALYEIAFLLLLVPILLRVRRTNAHEGDAFRVFLLAYLTFRLFVDFLKPDPPPLAGGLTAIQYACIGGIAYYCAIFVRRASRRLAATT
ncbi:MAG TPA: prolipoprotein diacylglyceryl transferase family protein [Thermoanaerobaculia bacterium]|nr:prolipoprotein diacylglyceryl transferase family protein [Thermoanaerobaculia bacterium]